MKVLLVQRRSLGDALYTAILGEVLKKELNGEVHFLTLPFAVEFFSNYRYLDKVIPYGGFWKTLKTLREEKYDAVLDYEATFRTYPLVLLSGARRRIAFYRKPRERFLYPIYNTFVEYQNLGFTYWDRLKLLEPLGVRVEKYLNYKPVWEFKEGVKPSAPLPEGDYLVLSPKGVIPSKEIKPPLAVELARRLAERTGLKVIFSVAPDEVDYMEKIKTLSGGEFPIFSRPLTDFAFLLEGAKALVSIESFPYHLALLMNKPSVVIVQGLGLFFRETFGLIKEYRPPLECVPCGKAYECKRGDFACTERIEVEKVVKLTEEILGN